MKLGCQVNGNVELCYCLTAKYKFQELQEPCKIDKYTIKQMNINDSYPMEVQF